MTANTLRCKYCAWVTQRFRGKKTYDWRGMTYGERQLRSHVQDVHEADYFRAQGLCPSQDQVTRYDNSWTYDAEAPLGEQAL